MEMEERGVGNSLERGRIFAGYEIECLLGAGGTGEVYLAQDRDLPRKIALKVLPPLASIDPTSGSGSNVKHMQWPR
jgi:serine/threonine-protein kinase